MMLYDIRTFSNFNDLIVYDVLNEQSDGTFAIFNGAFFNLNEFINLYKKDLSGLINYKNLKFLFQTYGINAILYFLTKNAHATSLNSFGVSNLILTKNIEIAPHSYGGYMAFYYRPEKFLIITYRDDTFFQIYNELQLQNYELFLIGRNELNALYNYTDITNFDINNRAINDFLFQYYGSSNANFYFNLKFIGRNRIIMKDIKNNYVIIPKNQNIAEKNVIEALYISEDPSNVYFLIKEYAQSLKAFLQSICKYDKNTRIIDILNEIYSPVYNDYTLLKSHFYKNDIITFLESMNQNRINKALKIEYCNSSENCIEIIQDPSTFYRENYPIYNLNDQINIFLNLSDETVFNKYVDENSSGPNEIFYYYNVLHKSEFQKNMIALPNNIYVYLKKIRRSLGLIKNIEQIKNCASDLTGIYNIRPFITRKYIYQNDAGKIYHDYKKIGKNLVAIEPKLYILPRIDFDFSAEQIKIFDFTNNSYQCEYYYNFQNSFFTVNNNFNKYYFQAFAAKILYNSACENINYIPNINDSTNYYSNYYQYQHFTDVKNSQYLIDYEEYWFQNFFQMYYLQMHYQPGILKQHLTNIVNELIYSFKKVFKCVSLQEKNKIYSYLDGEFVKSIFDGDLYNSALNLKNFYNKYKDIGYKAFIKMTMT